MTPKWKLKMTGKVRRARRSVHPYRTRHNGPGREGGTLKRPDPERARDSHTRDSTTGTRNIKPSSQGEQT